MGEYLLAEVEGPGAVVRTWSAGMGGTLRVFLDGARTPLYEGDAYAFLARKSEHFLERAGSVLEAGDAFVQQDADYLPIPFGRGLRVTWEGDLQALHFYHLEVRRYPSGTRVRTFDPVRDLRDEAALERAVAALNSPGVTPDEDRTETADLAPGTSWTLTVTAPPGGAALTRLRFQVWGADPWAALRGTLLQVSFDGAGRPHLEAPVGDLFGSGPGVNPFDSLPMTVSPDGVMTCRFVMPFREQAVLRLANTTGGTVHIEAGIGTSAWTWDERSLYFRAKWRSDADLDAASGPFDLPFLVAAGRGRFVGTAVFLVNPSATPTPGGNWWGEGDEKVFVDGEPDPVFIGTGSEDYFNYSWSRPDLFDHPYCGQPLDTGPGNLGYVSNHRWHLLDDVPFTTGLGFYMELWHHQAFPGLCYDRIAYWYAAPGATDDHRRVQWSELVVRDLPATEPQPIGGARDATFHHLTDLPVAVHGGAAVREPVQPGASRGRLLGWTARPGDRLELDLPVPEAGDYTVNLVAAHWPESGVLRLILDGEPLVVSNLGGAGEGTREQTEVVLHSTHARRLLSTGFGPRTLAAGTHRLVIECVVGGRYGFDYLWVRCR